MCREVASHATNLRRYTKNRVKQKDFLFGQIWAPNIFN